MNEIAQKLIFDGSSIVLLTAGLLNFFLCFYLLGKRTKINSKAKNYLAYSTFCVSIWLFSSWGNHFIQNETIVTYSSRVSYTVTIFALFFLIAFAFAYQDKRVSKLLAIVILFLGAFVFFTPFIIKTGTVASLAGKEGAVFGKYYPTWSVTILLLAIFLITQLMISFAKSKGIEREKVKYIFMFLGIAILLVITFNLILPNFGEVSYIFIGQYATFIFAAGISWVTFQERIYSLPYTIANFLATLTAGLVLFLLSWGTQRFEQVVLGWDVTQIFAGRIFILGIVVACFVAVYIDTLNPKVKYFYYKLFGLNILTLKGLQSWLLDKTNKSIDLSEYVKEFLHNLDSVLLTKGSALYIYKTKDLWENLRGVSLSETELAGFQKLRNIQTDERDGDIYGLIVPLFIEDEIFGVLVVGEKRTGGFFSKEEYVLIKNIIKVLLVAVNRYILYKEQKEFNELLEKKVNQATQELKHKNFMLEETLRKERDMMDILGHELRTPLTIARNSVLILKKKGKEELSSKDMEKYLEMAEENLVRESKLLETLLSTTKIDNKAINLVLEKVDMVDVVHDSLEGLRHKAQQKNLDLKFTKEDDVFVYTDRNRIQEVVDNLIDNAIKYTIRGFVHINLKTDKDMVKLEIADSGVGIPKDQILKLGQKFYRINTYLESSERTGFNVVRPGGTGLGLYVTFNLVKAMGGRIDVKSEIDKGSIFTVNLPAFKGQAKFETHPGTMKVFERFEKMREDKKK